MPAQRKYSASQLRNNICFCRKGSGPRVVEYIYSNCILFQSAIVVIIKLGIIILLEFDFYAMWLPLIFAAFIGSIRSSSSEFLTHTSAYQTDMWDARKNIVCALKIVWANEQHLAHDT